MMYDGRLWYLSFERPLLIRGWINRCEEERLTTRVEVGRLDLMVIIARLNVESMRLDCLLAWECLGRFAASRAAVLEAILTDLLCSSPIAAATYGRVVVEDDVGSARVLGV